MTDELDNGMDMSVSDNLSPTEEQAPNTEPAPEKMVPQHVVNKIAAQKARDAEERTERRLRAEFEAQQREAHERQPARQEPKDNSVSLDEDYVRNIIRQEAIAIREAEEQSRVAQEGQRILSDFQSKVDSYSLENPDFAQVFPQLGIQEHPALLYYANQMQNTGDVLNELAKAPGKYATLITLSATAPQLVQHEMKKLSDSIAKNKAALNQPTAKPPLSHTKPSLIGSGSDNDLSVSDFRSIFKG